MNHVNEGSSDTTQNQAFTRLSRKHLDSLTSLFFF